MNQGKTKDALKTTLIVIICIIVLGFLLYYATKLISESRNTYGETENNNNNIRVMEIIDGDTFRLESGEVIRLICVDTPEKNESGYDEAVSYLGGRLIYENINLERVKIDKYNRTLAWVFVADVLVNKEIVEGGFASLFEYEDENCSRIKN